MIFFDIFNLQTWQYLILRKQRISPSRVLHNGMEWQCIMTPGGWQEVACISTLYHESLRTHSAFGSGEALASQHYQLLLVPCRSQPVALHSHRSTASCIELLNAPSMRRELMQGCTGASGKDSAWGQNKCHRRCSSPVRGDAPLLCAGKRQT
jgi:hypothetical protein